MYTDPLSLVGTKIGEHFSIDEVVRDRPACVVYRGKRIAKDEPVTLTVYKVPLALDPAQKEAFIVGFREDTRAQSKLLKQNEQFARSIGTGVLKAADSNAILPYVVTEWIDGHSLAEELEDRRGRATAYPVAGIIDLLFPAVDAVAEMHDLGLAHGDLHPSSLLLHASEDGLSLKVLDFGVAKVLVDLVGRVAPADRADHLFSPQYAAPEHFDPGVPLTPASDVYCLALVLVEGLGNRPPVEGTTREELEAATRNPQKRPSPRALGLAVGDAFERVMLRAVAVDPAARWRDAGELWDALRGAVDEDRAAATAAAAAAVAAAKPAPVKAVSANPVAAKSPAKPPADEPVDDVTVGDTVFEPLPSAHLLAAIHEALKGPRRSSVRPPPVSGAAAMPKMPPMKPVVVEPTLRPAAPPPPSAPPPSAEPAPMSLDPAPMSAEPASLDGGWETEAEVDVVAPPKAPPVPPRAPPPAPPKPPAPVAAFAPAAPIPFEAPPENAPAPVEPLAPPPMEAPPVAPSLEALASVVVEPPPMQFPPPETPLFAPSRPSEPTFVRAAPPAPPAWGAPPPGTSTVHTRFLSSNIVLIVVGGAVGSVALLSILIWLVARALF